MLESLVANILNRFLKNYVSNLNYDQLKIGIWKGEVNLNDLKLRRDALDKLNLPINVSEGYLGQLTLVIPWSNLRSEPVKVIVDHVYLLAEPKSEANLSVEEEEERLLNVKRRRLATAEILDAPPTEKKNTEQDNSSDGFLNQLTTKIIDNLQFTIKNIHVRYEDKISDPGHPFAVGVTLKELSGVSTDSDWQPKFINDSANTINKLVTLESLSVYWNTDTKSLAGMHHEEASEVFTEMIPTSTRPHTYQQYLLKPVSGTGKVKLNKKFGGDVPKTDVALMFDEIAFGLDDHQYRDCILMLDLFHANLKKQKYLKFHPQKSKTAKTHPREFFKFAGQAVLSEIHEKNYKWSWDHFRTRRDQRLQYIECYVAFKLNKSSPEQTSALEELERILSFEDIRLYRSMAKGKIRTKQIKLDLKNQKKKEENANKTWWGWITGSSKTNTNNETKESEESDENIQITEEQRQELYHAIEYEEDKPDIASSMDIPRDTVKFYLKTKLNRGSFTLKKNVKKKTEQDLLSIVFNAVSLDTTQYTESIKIGAALGDFQLFDGSVQNTVYRQLIGVKTKNDRSTSLLDSNYNLKELERRKSSITTHDEHTANQTDPFFDVVFEHKPLHSSADNALSLKMRHLEIIYNPELITGIIDFFRPPSSKMESVNALMAVAGDTFEELKLQTRAGLEFALETHTTLDVDIDMDAPIIFIPESLTSQDSSVLVIDAGHINIDSQLADTKLVEDMKAKDITKYNAQDSKNLENLMYDKFNLQLTQTKILIGSVQECLQQLQNKAPMGSVDPRLVDRMDMNFLVELCILPGKTEFTKFKISGHLPLISVNVSDSKYKIFMKILDIVIPNTTEEAAKKAAPVTRDTSSNLMQSRFYNNQDFLFSNTRNELAVEKKKITATDAEQFKLVFQVDKVSAMLHETCVVRGEKKDDLLCEIVLENFELVVITRPLDLFVDVSLKALDVIDKMEHGNEFHYLVTSGTFDKQTDPNSDQNLITVKYKQASKQHPEFMSTYDGYDQTVDCMLSTFTAIVTRNSVLRIYNWVMKTFTGPSSSPESSADEGKDATPDEQSSHRRSFLVADSQSALQKKRRSSKINIQPKTNVSRMKVGIHMDSINLILNNDGTRLGTLELSFGDLVVKMDPSTLEVFGRFGNFTLSDDTILARSHSLNTPASEKFIVSIVGEDLANFSYRTYDPKKKETYPGYNQGFKLRMGSIQVVVTESLQPTLNFLTEFLEMKFVFDAARNAALETAQQNQEEGNRFHFDVLVKSPLVVFPVKSDTIVAHLGEIRARNKYVEVERRDVNNVFACRQVPVAKIECGLYEISLESRSDGASIIEDMDIAFEIESPERPDSRNGPNSQIRGLISDVQMSLTDKQYASLLQVWNMVQTSFLVSPSPQVVEENSPTDSGGNTPSLRSIDSHRSQESQVEQRSISLDLQIKLDKVCLEVINTNETLEARHQAFSRLSFNGIAMNLQTMWDESTRMEIKMQSINFSDTRTESDSQFKEILPSNTLQGPQFQFKMAMFKQDKKSVTDMEVVIDSPKVILSLDYLLLLKDFFIRPFLVAEPTEAQKFAQSHGRNEEDRAKIQQAQQLSSQTGSVFRYRVNVVDLEVICLASPERETSEAVLLSFNQLTIDQQEILKVGLEGIGMVLCRMDNVKESALHFVEQFDISLEVHNAAPNSVHNLMSVQLYVKPVIMRLSYQDAMLIMAIANKGLALMGTEERAHEPDPVRAQPEDSDENENEDSETIRKPNGIEPYIVISKESLSARFEGIQVVLIEDLHDLPFIDLQLNAFEIHASDWSRALKADADFSVAMKSFNFKNSHWEPFLEPWQFCIKVSQNPTDKSLRLVLDTQEQVYLNVTHTFIESSLMISQTMSEVRPLAKAAQTQVKPYLLVNMTGYDLEFWNMSDDAGNKRQRHELKNGESMPWTFRNWKKRREKINLGKNLFGVRIKANEWQTVQNVALDREGQLAYRLKPETNGVFHRLVVDICLGDHVKKVTFQSGLLFENSSLETMELAIVNGKREIVSRVVRLGPAEVYSAPIEQCYDQWVVIRPSERYNWSEQMFVWSDVLLASFPGHIECKPVDGSVQPSMNYLFQLKKHVDEKSALMKRYPLMKIEFCAPIEIENLLPFDLVFSLTEAESNMGVDRAVKKGGKACVHHLRGDRVLKMSVDLSTERYQRSEYSTIETGPKYNSMDEKLVIKDREQVPTHLKMHVSRTVRKIDGLYVGIYAPYLIVNKSGLPIRLRPKHLYQQSKLPVESLPAYSEGERIEPVIFSYAENSYSNRSQISIDGSKWSEPISFEAVGNSQDVTLLSKTDTFARHAGIRVEEGRRPLRLTKVVTISPRYILKNNTDIPLEFSEFGTDQTINMGPDERKALFQTSRSSVRWLCVRLAGAHHPWSSPVNIQDIGKTYVKADKATGEIPCLIRVSVYMTDSTIFATFSKDEEWPYYVVNDSSVDVQFAQEEIDPHDYHLKKSWFPKPRKFHLPSGERIKYSWDVPVAKEKRLVLSVGDRRRNINFEAVGMQVPFRYMKHRDGAIGSNTLSIDIVARDAALVLHITDFNLSKSLYRPKSSATSTLASISREGSVRDAFEAVDVQQVVNSIYEIHLVGLGISINDKNAEELAFVTVKGIDLKYTDSNMYQSLRLGVEWFQMDNQLYGSTYPILCYPTTLPKVATELTTHPTLHIALDKVKDDQHGVMYFKTFSFLLQEMTFEVDETFLYALLDFSQFQNAPAMEKEPGFCFVMDIAQPGLEKSNGLYYFEEFCIQPMRLNLSCVRSEKLKAAQQDSRNTPIGFVFNVFTMTLGNINDAPIKLNALMVDHLRASSEELCSRITLHYRDQIVYQIHRVLGSIDIFGNPVGLFNTLSSGFGELFYEPYQGFVMSDRPQDVGIGIAKGLGGFMKKGIFGVTDSMSKFTGSIGKGLSAATMDKRFQEKRRIHMTRNKPTHAIYGVTHGKRPVEGAEENGVVGFVEGVGRGIVGVFTKPVVGFFDMASNVTAGIRETTTVFEGAEITRERLPRFVGRDGILQPYSQRQALGQMWLKEMENQKFMQDNYLAHTVTANDQTIAILTYQNLIVMQSDDFRMDWCLALDWIDFAEVSPDGIQLHVKKNHPRSLCIEKETSRVWFAKEINSTLQQRKEERDRQ